METSLPLHRFQFAFTIAYHYIFPQLTMGLALVILVMKTMALRSKKPIYDQCALFWARIFGINFAMGVVTGIPLEFQFGTNWAEFTSGSGKVIGQLLGMEGIFSFFLESAFLALFVYGAKKMSPVAHWFTALAVCTGSWLSGFFITTTNAFMQHPVGYATLPDGTLHLTDFGALFTNPWLMWQYPHVMMASLVTATFVVSGVGAYYLLAGKHEEHGKTFLEVGVIMGMGACMLVGFPTGDQQAHNVYKYQPEKFAAMEGLFRTEQGAGLILIGQPDVENMRLDNPIHVPKILSFITQQRFDAEVKGLEAFPREDWPDQIPLLYYCYHIMIGLGTMLTGVMGLSAFLLWRKKLFTTRGVLWALMLAVPFPYIANLSGWFTAELGRQPWIIYKVMRTKDAFSTTVSGGNVMFTLLGFMGMYTLLSFLFAFLIGREVMRGPCWEKPAEGHDGDDHGDDHDHGEGGDPPPTHAAHAPTGEA